MNQVRHRGRRAAALLGAALFAALTGTAGATGTDQTGHSSDTSRVALSRALASAERPRTYRTPVAHGSATARTAVSAPQLARGLSAAFRGAGRAGAFVLDTGTDQVLFQRGGSRARVLASNMKLFTTAAALERFGPDARLETTVWAGDDFSDGVVSEGLFLRGSGDPTLGSKGLAKLATRVKAAGVSRVLGPLLYDDSFLDQHGTVPQHGVRRESVGVLSALTFSGSAPARTTARRFIQAVRRAGISIARKAKRRTTPPLSTLPTDCALPPCPPPATGPFEVASLGSPTVADIARATNVPSNNYLAEMLLKDIGGAFGGAGSTRAGLAEVSRFAAERGASVRGENGSGLSRRNRASPASVASLLDSMLEIDEKGNPEEQQEDERLRDAFVRSLAVAGRSGTLARRMRGSAAQGNCHAKTGTLSGVSALSGYCFRGPAADAEHAVAFSILMSGDVGRAHRIQDRAAAMIARYSP
jgi:serine-type D-Ala-D-Ala carboxypeptidase/endopeptidase (penicillin-binding protein 4)